MRGSGIGGGEGVGALGGEEYTSGLSMGTPGKVISGIGRSVSEVSRAAIAVNWKGVKRTSLTLSCSSSPEPSFQGHTEYRRMAQGICIPFERRLSMSAYILPCRGLSWRV
eukprot:CAMPEP_0184342882 /NCGR_PEP_ID=MMETSP1089-20130417/11451_1 /TAXON_ID=38269 ORGANISM="Gloeochaete wittrockiana, Strain SAG46.84" /NCGR_SAMPLE_ID=MMETSP1089 /ASSEMBLY_ACC=CAM_ASM_000445 /LENGTH=109 /DNA_ID=CAMNT_0026671941 /DNA_START=493 /DNA_END=823 /DNA_ORIENTATION=-